jgi:hypothetical protein
VFGLEFDGPGSRAKLNTGVISGALHLTRNGGRCGVGDTDPSKLRFGQYVHEHVRDHTRLVVGTREGGITAHAVPPPEAITRRLSLAGYLFTLLNSFGT